MTNPTASRPTCVYVLPSLKKNSTILMCLMAAGIAMSLYGAYVESKMKLNPNYYPTLAVGRYLLNNPVTEKLGALGVKAFRRCDGSMPNQIANAITRSIALISGLIHIAQIVLLKLYSRSVSVCSVIMGLSIFGLTLAGVHVAASIMSCKAICLTCLGIHNIAIIVFICKRKQILQNSMCPVSGRNTGASCIPGATQVANVASQLRKRVTGS